MIILGLTGGIGTGKSWIATCFARLGVPVFDADYYVHQLLVPGGAAAQKIRKQFPYAADASGGINRKTLGAIIFKDEDARHRLEAIIHPMVRKAEHAFIHKYARRNAPLIVLDIPLLYETGADQLCDLVAVVYTRESTRLARLVQRGTHDAATIERIKMLQAGEAEKQRRADILIPNGLSKIYSLHEIKRLMNGLKTYGTRNRTRYGNHRI